MLNRFCLVLCMPFVVYAVAHTEDGELRNLQNSLIERAGLNGTGLPTLEDAQSVFKQKCLKEADEAAYVKADKAKDDLKDCILGLIDLETIKDEIEEKRKTGDMDIVFKKYCRKSPELKQCVSNFTDSVEPCLNKKERDNVKIILNVTESLTNFICYKEGDRIALFIAEGGPECLQEKQDGIQDCVNSTMSKYIPEEKPTIENIPELLLQDEQCDDLTKLQDCIVNELTTCAEPTPSNIAEALFKFIRQVTPCGAKKATTSSKHDAQRSNTASAGAMAFVNSLLLIVSVLFISC